MHLLPNARCPPPISVALPTMGAHELLSSHLTNARASEANSLQPLSCSSQLLRGTPLRPYNKSDPVISMLRIPYIAHLPRSNPF